MNFIQLKPIITLILIQQLILTKYCFADSTIWAPYQVTIRMYDNFSPNSLNLCNGACIHESFILTTAHCMYSYILSANISRPIQPGMIYVVAGDFSQQPIITQYINTIIIHENYNRFTLENDIALLKLEQPLPLQNSTSVKWVELEDTAKNYANCFVNFNNESSKIYPFTKPKFMLILDNWFCNKSTNFTSLRKDDLCSHYISDDSFMCKLPSSQLLLSADRGTPLVCNSRLTGLLSSINSPENSTSNSNETCSGPFKTTAYYTNVGQYVSWIYTNIGIQRNGTSHQLMPGAPPYYAPTPVPSTVSPTKGGGKGSSNSIYSVTWNYLIIITIFLSYIL